MAFNGSGTYALTYNFVTEAASPPIEISKLKAEFDGIATGLSTCIARDGQSTVSADIPFNDNKITGLADATADTDAVNRQTGDGRYLIIAQNSQNDNYTCVAGDSGKHILQTGASKTITIPSNASVAYALGTTLTFATLVSGGCSIAITDDTLRMAGTSSTGTRTLAQYGLATAVKVGSTTWLISGAGLT